jgi:hypothetical protein
MYIMPGCNGRGDCLKQCGCNCFEDSDCEIRSPICRCSHKNHITLIGGNSECYIYCKDTCPHMCTLVECYNYKMCGQKRPQNIIDSHNGMCMDCAILVGRIKFLDNKNECPICLIYKDMIEITCGKHTVCIECWKKWSEESTQSPLTCPLCRQSIWK